jgi:predicted acylesterase/phospholipase RssA
MADPPYRVLTLDGGGAKGFYTLGVLREIEGLIGVRLHEKFDLIFGTSTGAIIGAMLALGHSVDEIHTLYQTHVVSIMACKKPADKTARLKALAEEVFGEKKFEEIKTALASLRPNGSTIGQWSSRLPKNKRMGGTGRSNPVSDVLSPMLSRPHARRIRSSRKRS